MNAITPTYRLAIIPREPYVGARIVADYPTHLDAVRAAIAAGSDNDWMDMGGGLLRAQDTTRRAFRISVPEYGECETCTRRIDASGRGHWSLCADRFRAATLAALAPEPVWPESPMEPPAEPSHPVNQVRYLAEVMEGVSRTAVGARALTLRPGETAGYGYVLADVLTWNGRMSEDVDAAPIIDLVDNEVFAAATSLDWRTLLAEDSGGIADGVPVLSPDDLAYLVRAVKVAAAGVLPILDTPIGGCPDCDGLDDDERPSDAAHVGYPVPGAGRATLITCEGFWTVDPAILGLAIEPPSGFASGSLDAFKGDVADAAEAVAEALVRLAGAAATLKESATRYRCTDEIRYALKGYPLGGWAGADAENMRAWACKMRAALNLPM